MTLHGALMTECLVVRVRRRQICPLDRWSAASGVYKSQLLLDGVGALGAMTPGASLAVVTRHTLRGSARAGVGAGLAQAAGIGVYALALRHI